MLKFVFCKEMKGVEWLPHETRKMLCFLKSRIHLPFHVNEGMPVYLNSTCIYNFLISPYDARCKCL